MSNNSMMKNEEWKEGQVDTSTWGLGLPAVSFTLTVIVSSYF